MYLRTPKRYTAKGRRRYLLNLRWLWLYILFPVVLIPLLLLWNARAEISQSISEWTARNIKININPPTPTPTIPAPDLRASFEAYIKAGNMNNAISTLGSLADVSPNDLAVHTLLTQMILFRGDPDDARRHEAALAAAQGAVNANPEAPEGWIVMGMALNSSGQPRAALAYLLRARDLDAQNPLLLAVLAEAYNDLDQVDQAEDLASRAIEAAQGTEPLNIAALAYAHIVQGNIASRESGDEAIKGYESAWRAAITEPSLPLGFIVQWITGYYLTANEPDRLVDILTQASERDKDDAINPYLLGRVYLNSGDREKAQTYFERCIELDAGQLKCLRWLSYVLYGAGNYQRAAELAQRAVDQGSKDPAVYVTAGAAYADTNRCAEAVSVLRRGQLLDTEATFAQQFADQLRKCGASAATPAPTATGQPGG